MPLPVSGRRGAGEAFGLAAKELAGKWSDFAPKDEMGRSFGHGEVMEPVLRVLSGGGMTGSDDTGSIDVGPQGFTLDAPDWALTVNPAGSASYRSKSGNWSAGGQWGGAPAGFVQMGGLTLEGGYGDAPGGSGPSGEGYGASGSGGAVQPGGWGKVSYSTGPKVPAMVRSDAAQRAVTGALSGVAPVSAAQPAIRTAREELEDQMSRYRASNPQWYRP